MRKPYFVPVQNAPAPLSLTVKRRVRFEEVDSMGIVWHGCYPSYFEDARVALGHRYGISYSDFIRERIPVPVRQMQIDYFYPLRFEEEMEITAILHWSDAARINFEYRIRNDSRQLVCTGCTVQMMLDRDLNVLLAPPPFFAAFLHRWKQGELA
ncbi:MAG: acyl-CoA thioesterase [Sedimentisphaerales bacterium]|nr:acyl-CoA thioesterase [Sedimentisphaerales bacterium]